MNTIILLFFLGAIVIIWYESLRIREIVIWRCKQVCEEAELQLLDQTVALVFISLAKSVSGLPCIARRYQFEVSKQGTDRYKGYVNLTGKRITTIQFDGPDGETVIYQQ